MLSDYVLKGEIVRDKTIKPNPCCFNEIIKPISQINQTIPIL